MLSSSIAGYSILVLILYHILNEIINHLIIILFKYSVLMVLDIIRLLESWYRIVQSQFLLVIGVLLLLLHIDMIWVLRNGINLCTFVLILLLVLFYYIAYLCYLETF